MLGTLVEIGVTLATEEEGAGALQEHCVIMTVDVQIIVDTGSDVGVGSDIEQGVEIGCDCGATEEAAADVQGSTV